MLGEVLHFYIPEGSPANVQGYRQKLGAFLFNFLYQLGSKMHSSSRCSHGSPLGGKNALVAFFVFVYRLTFYIGWQRHLAELIQLIVELLAGSFI